MTARRAIHLRAESPRACRPARGGFTLVELMAVLIIISILASLTLTGLALSRQRAKAVRTETTIRKIHEVVMPHYERYLSRSTLPGSNNPTFFRPLPTTVQARYRTLVQTRRLQAIELPDDWRDLQPGPGGPSTIDPAWLVDPSSPLPPINQNLACETAISRRLRANFAIAPPAEAELADAECLWAIVMLSGFADPGIIAHFREDEFADTNQNGFREFIDGWGKPIRFLRWAPGFISKYQPAGPATSAAADARSHDVFDTTAIDPLAVNTLYPLIFSGGRDELPDIAHRSDAPDFRYPAVAFDPYFMQRPSTLPLPAGVRGFHLFVPVGAGGYGVAPYPYPFTQPSAMFGERISRPGLFGPSPARSDDIHNHALSR